MKINGRTATPAETAVSAARNTFDGSVNGEKGDGHISKEEYLTVLKKGFLYRPENHHPELGHGKRHDTARMG